VSTIFTEFPIEEVEQLNALLASCSCCELPVCPVVVVQYQSLSYLDGDDEPAFPSLLSGSDIAASRDGDELVKIRYRFKVPAVYSGNSYTVRWDLSFFPKDWYLPPAIITEPEILYSYTWEWTPVISRNSPWFEIASPVEEGTIEIVNLAVNCY
jgi:hypothetical protein